MMKMYACVLPFGRTKTLADRLIYGDDGEALVFTSMHDAKRAKPAEAEILPVELDEGPAPETYLDMLIVVWASAPAHSREEEDLSDMIDAACGRLGIEDPVAHSISRAEHFKKLVRKIEGT